VDFHLSALTLTEARSYIRHRLVVAGGDPAIFQRSAIDFIHARSRGIPRLINQLCDLSLVYAFAEQRRRINSGLVSEVLQDRSRGNASALFDESAASAVIPPSAADDGLITERA
jgi:hypothetical protein